MRVNQTGIAITSLLLLASPAWSSPNPSISDSSISELSVSKAASDLFSETQPISNASQGISAETMSLYAQTSDSVAPQTEASPVEASPSEESPTFRRWREKIPNVLDEIRNDPSFRTRFRLGLSYFPSTYDSLGWNVGIEDIFLGKSRFTLSGDYQSTFTGDRKAGGADLRYYLLPLGGYVNLAPVVGYRYLETPRYVTDGLNVGARLQFVPSRTGGADISLTQTWVAPQQSEEVGLTKLSFGYALTKQLRLSTDIEKQNSKQKKDTRFGISLEWMF